MPDSEPRTGEHPSTGRTDGVGVFVSPAGPRCPGEPASSKPESPVPTSANATTPAEPTQ